MKKIWAIFALLLVIAMLICSCSDNGDAGNAGNSGDSGNAGNSGDNSKPEKEPVYYTVEWKDENGTLLKSESVEEGKVASYTYTPNSTAEWKMTLDGWSTSLGGEKADLSAITANTTYYAVVSKMKQTYTVKFESGYETAIASQTVEYGGVATAPTLEERSGYKFVSWYTDTEFTTEADFSSAVTGNITYYAKWKEVPNVLSMLKILLSGFKCDPYSYIPETMRPAYENNLVNASELVNDYSSSINVSAVKSGGFGEQWNMIIENIQEAEIFFNVLSAVDGLATISVAAFEEYLDKNPENTAAHSFTSGIYTVTINYSENLLSYVLDFTGEFPAVGSQSAQIALAMNTESGEKAVRIQLGNANVVKYVVTENSYEFAIKYLGVRRAYFSLTNDDGKISGHIYEYLTYENIELASAADFYVDDNYASAVGNKADGMLGFTGYISELYDIKTGKLIAYEVQETLSSITYNTLWFDLSSISGISALRYEEKTETEAAKFFVNGSSEAWKTKNVGGIGAKMFSRRFDIEFRTQYFYSYDQTADKYTKHAVKVPMMFVQEEVLSDFASDVKSTNGITVSILTPSANLNRLTSDYDSLIPIFIENKSIVTTDNIISFIG